MPPAEFEPTIWVLERLKKVHVLNYAATVIGLAFRIRIINVRMYKNCNFKIINSL
jgi:hypothetical protein